MAIVILALMVLGIRWSNSEHNERVDKCKQVKLGVSEKEAISILGTPDRTRVGDSKGRKVRFLEYDAPAIVATAPYVVIDNLSGLIIKVTCDDTYHLQAQELK
jgi:hypothetical protein